MTSYRGAASPRVALGMCPCAACVALDAENPSRGWSPYPVGKSSTPRLYSRVSDRGPTNTYDNALSLGLNP